MTTETTDFPATEENYAYATACLDRVSEALGWSGLYSWDALAPAITRLTQERDGLQARVRDLSRHLTGVQEERDTAERQERKARARIAELEGALREMLRLRDGRIANDVAVDPIREVLTPTAPAREGEAKLCHFPSCLCPGATECEVERYDGPTGRGEVGRE